MSRRLPTLTLRLQRMSRSTPSPITRSKIRRFSPGRELAEAGNWRLPLWLCAQTWWKIYLKKAAGVACLPSPHVLRRVEFRAEWETCNIAAMSRDQLFVAAIIVRSCRLNAVFLIRPSICWILNVKLNFTVERHSALSFERLTCLLMGWNSAAVTTNSAQLPFPWAHRVFLPDCPGSNTKWILFGFFSLSSS